jgi:arginyl-tRNA synthetase
VTPAELSRTVLRTVRRAVEADELSLSVLELPEQVLVQRPPRPGCGDYATNVALKLAGPAGRPPRQVAEILRRHLALAPGIARVDIAEPGFLNITLDAVTHADLVRAVRQRGPAYGHGEGLRDVRVTIVPADPQEARATVVAEAANRLLRAGGAQEGPPEPAKPQPVAAPLDELLRALGPDAARWALLRPPPGDVPQPDPAVHLTQRASNPLFRVRYAHARTRALLRNAHDLGIEPAAGDHAAYRHPAETDLLGLIADFPRVVDAAARHRAPDRVARHAERTADAFFRFHDECPVLPKGDEKPSAVHGARLALAEAAGTVLANGLTLLGISAPDHL